MTGGELASAALGRLRALHAGRPYHGWGHVEALLALHAETCRAGLLDRPGTVRLAILFHDAVCVPGATGNEAASADLAGAWLAGAVPGDDLARVRRGILATADHSVPPGLDPGEAGDLGHLLDMDLAILGADGPEFERYEAAIRAEYAHVAEPDYRRGRAAFADAMAARPAIYASPWGRARWETRARANLAGLAVRLRLASRGRNTPEWH